MCTNNNLGHRPEVPVRAWVVFAEPTTFRGENRLGEQARRARVCGTKLGAAELWIEAVGQR
jgi:hypothetical protein